MAGAKRRTESGWESAAPMARREASVPSTKISGAVYRIRWIVLLGIVFFHLEIGGVYKFKPEFEPFMSQYCLGEFIPRKFYPVDYN